MTGNQMELVRSSFTEAVDRRDDFATFFYACLFDISPEMRPLFGGDMETQAQRFTEMIAVAINGQNGDRGPSEALQMLGSSHRRADIETGHYAPFGRALVWSLQQTLGNDFTPEMKQAWEDWYETVAQTMAAARTIDA